MLFLKFNCVLSKCYVLSNLYVNKSSLTVTASCNRKEQESQYCMHWNIWMMGLQLILQFLLMKTRYLQFILNGFFFIIFTFLLLLVSFLLRMGLVQNERLSASILSSLTCWIIAKII